MQSPHTSFSLTKEPHKKVFFPVQIYSVVTLEDGNPGQFDANCFHFRLSLFCRAQFSREEENKSVEFLFFLFLFGQYQCMCVPNWGVPTRISSFFSLAPPFYCHLLLPSFFRVKEKEKQVHSKKNLVTQQCKFNCTGIPFEHFSCHHFLLISYTRKLW